MGVRQCRLISEGQGDIVAAYAGDRERTWVVTVDDVTDTEDTIYESGYLPLIGSILGGNMQMTLRSYSPSREGKFSFRITGRYSSRQETPSERDERQKQLYVVPWYRPPTITCPVQEWSDEPLKDINNQGIHNSFGTPFTSTQPRRRWTPIIRVKAPVQTIPSFYYSLAGKRNASAVTVTRKTGSLPTFAAGTLLFVPGEIGEYVVEGVYTYEFVSFELHYHEREWKWEPVDMGPRYRNGSGEQADFTDGMGFLDGVGGEGIDPNNPTFLDFQYYPTASFAGLPLTEF